MSSHSADLTFDLLDVSLVIPHFFGQVAEAHRDPDDDDDKQDCQRDVDQVEEAGKS